MKNRIKKLYKKIKIRKNSIVGDNFQFSHKANCFSKNKSNIIIGNNCLLYGTLYSMNDGKIIVGNNTCIFDSTFIGSNEEIKIGNCVIISNNVTIYDNNNHPISPKVRLEMCEKGFFGDDWNWNNSKCEKVVIEDGVWIGEKSTILKGVRIGRGSIVATHSVVTKDVPEYVIVAGNPARIVKDIANE